MADHVTTREASQTEGIRHCEKQNVNTPGVGSDFLSQTNDDDHQIVEVAEYGKENDGNFPEVMSNR